MNIMDWEFHNIMFTDTSVNFILSEADYRQFTEHAEAILQTYPCDKVFVDVVGFDEWTWQYVWKFYLYKSVEWVIQQIQYVWEVAISKVVSQKRNTQSDAIAVLSR